MFDAISQNANNTIVCNSEKLFTWKYLTGYCFHVKQRATVYAVSRKKHQKWNVTNTLPLAFVAMI